jgi:hypothetical protein
MHITRALAVECNALHNIQHPVFTPRTPKPSAPEPFTLAQAPLTSAGEDFQDHKLEALRAELREGRPQPAVATLSIAIACCSIRCCIHRFAKLLPVEPM